MASFTVTLPDGTSYTVDGLPEDATDADALAAVLANDPQAAAGDDSLQQWLGVTTRALLPYGVAAGAGAAVGAPIGGVGAAPGAALGVLGLGAADLGVGAYNIGAGLLGGDRVALPSETIRRSYEALGGPGTSTPQTTAQRIYSAGLEAAVPAGGTAKAFNVLSDISKPGVARNVMTELGRGVRAQAVGGAGSGAATQTAIEGGETDPLKLFLISALGGVTGTLAGGRTPRPLITGEDVRAQAKSFYKAMERAGVFFTPQAADDLANRLEQTLQRQAASINSRDRAAVGRVVRDLRNRPNADLSFEELEALRSALGMVGRDATTGKVTQQGAQASRMAEIVQDELDSFVNAAGPTQVTAGDPRVAARAVQQARKQWSNARKGEILEQVLAKVETNVGAKPQIQVLQERLAPIVSDRRLMQKFSPREREALQSLQSGTLTENALKTFGQLAPELNIQKVLGYAIPATAAASTQPQYLGALAGLAGAALAAKAAANRMAMRRASDVAEGVLQGRPPLTGAQNMLRAAARSTAYVPPVVYGGSNAFLTDANGVSYDAQGNVVR